MGNTRCYVLYCCAHSRRDKKILSPKITMGCKNLWILRSICSVSPNLETKHHFSLFFSIFILLFSAFILLFNTNPNTIFLLSIIKITNFFDFFIHEFQAKRMRIFQCYSQNQSNTCIYYFDSLHINYKLREILLFCLISIYLIFFKISFKKLILKGTYYHS